MIVYSQMARKKTREQKIRSSERILTREASYSFKAKEIPTKRPKGNIQTPNYRKKEIKKIVITSGIIFALNIILFILFTNNILTLGVFGY